jgi:hypothetical protein
MKRVFAMVVVVIAIGTAASGAYTYTVGPGELTNPMSLHDDESMLMQGGWGVTLNMFDWSSIRIESTTPLGYMTGGLWEMYMSSYSSATIVGGEINGINVSQHSHLTMSGGTLNSIHGTLYWPVPTAPADKYIQFICKSYLYNSATNRLTGVWGNDSTFAINLYDTPNFPTTFESINFTIVPEPLSLGLLALGGLLVRRYRRR